MGGGVLIAKFDSSGKIMWGKAARGHDPSAGYDEANGIIIDKSGNAYITGDYNEPSITFGKFTLYNAGPANFNYSVNIFVTKYDSMGNIVWAKNIGGIGGDVVDGISSDAEGNLYLDGEFNSPSIGFDNDTLIANEYGSFFVAKLENSITGVNTFNFQTQIFPFTQIHPIRKLSFNTLESLMRAQSK